MPRPPAILQSDFPYHITARCLNREWFCLPIDRVWEIYCRQLYFVNKVYSVRIHAFVLMTNHFHLLMSTPEANLSEAMQNFMKETSRWINHASHRINQTYGGRCSRSIVSSQHYYRHVYKYLYRNPVKAGLCKRVEDYPYSTLRGLLGMERLFIPLVEDSLLMGAPERTLEWLNMEPTVENWKTVQIALRRGRFRLPRDQAAKRAHQLETDAL